MADRVKVAWTGTGVGTVTLGSAIAGFQSYPAALDGLSLGYLIEHTGEGINQVEVGLGTFSNSAGTLTRDTVKFSTSAGAKVDFVAGTKHVSRVLLSDEFNDLDDSHAATKAEVDAIVAQKAINTVLGFDSEGEFASRTAGNGITIDDTNIRATFGATSTTVAAGNRGLPAGGTTGQSIRKASGSDYDFEFFTPAAGGGDSYNFVGDATDYSTSGSPAAPFDVLNDATDGEERRFTATIGTNQIDFAAGVAEDRYGWFDIGSGATAEIIGDPGVTINGLGNRASGSPANPAIAVRGRVEWRATALNVIELSGAIDEGTQDVFQATNFNDAVVSRPELRDYAETSSQISSSAGTLVIDLETGNDFEVTLTEDITTVTISNPPASGKRGSFTLDVIQDISSPQTDRTITWPASVKWPGGTAPTLSSGHGAIDSLALRTRDGGTTWLGYVAGQAFA